MFKGLPELALLIPLLAFCLHHTLHDGSAELPVFLDGTKPCLLPSRMLPTLSSWETLFSAHGPNLLISGLLLLPEVNEHHFLWNPS